MPANPTEVAELLELKGVDASLDFGPSPTDVVVATQHGQIMLAAGFNVEGWEAVLDRCPDADPLPLLDGPDADATADEVAEWALRLASDPHGYVA